MDSRMDKYRDEEQSLSRVARNEDLYKDLNKQELNSFEVKSNATVLGDHEDKIDIEKIKKILDTRYKDAPRRKSIHLEEREEEASIVPELSTKEYDLNDFLAKAKNEKEETYAEERTKKLRDTQFDILNNLHLNNDEDEENIKLPDAAKEKEEDADLVNLINTITINEVKQTKEAPEEGSPLDILEDLKGNDNTEVFEGIKEEINKVENTSKMNNTIISEELKKEVKEEVLEEPKDKQVTGVDNTFYTTTNLFKKKDFVDDEYNDNEKLGIGIKILIYALVIAFLAGLFMFIKTFLGF